MTKICGESRLTGSKSIAENLTKILSESRLTGSKWLPNRNATEAEADREVPTKVSPQHPRLTAGCAPTGAVANNRGQEPQLS